MPELLVTAPASFAFAGGDAAVGPGLDLVSSDVTAPELDRLMRTDQLLNPDGTPSLRFMTIWQNFAEAIEAALAGLTDQVTDLSAIVRAIQAAQDKADAALAAANEVSEARALADSYTDPPTVLTLDADGTADIAAHNRVYANGTRVAVNAGALSGLSGYVTIYYNDAARAGGAVTYLATTSPVSQEGAVHIVGQGTIPAAGSPPASGSGPSAPGYSPPSGGSKGSYVN